MACWGGLASGFDSVVKTSGAQEHGMGSKLPHPGFCSCPRSVKAAAPARAGPHLTSQDSKSEKTSPAAWNICRPQ